MAVGQQGERGTQGSIYAYQTREGTRYRFTFRDAAGKQSTRRGFTSRTAARRERERLMGSVHQRAEQVGRDP